MRIAMAAVAVTVLLACSDPSGVERPQTATMQYDGVELRLSVSPQSVSRGDEFRLTFEIDNAGETTETLTVLCNIVVQPVVDGPQGAAFLEGLPLGCGDVVWPLTLGPNEGYGEQYVARARGSDGSPVAPGWYELRANVLLPDAPDMSVWLRVE